jgi:hypothetical protein
MSRNFGKRTSVTWQNKEEFKEKIVENHLFTVSVVLASRYGATLVTLPTVKYYGDTTTLT